MNEMDGSSDIFSSIFVIFIIEFLHVKQQQQQATCCCLLLTVDLMQKKSALTDHSSDNGCDKFTTLLAAAENSDRHALENDIKTNKFRLSVSWEKKSLRRHQMMD